MKRLLLILLLAGCSSDSNATAANDMANGSGADMTATADDGPPDAATFDASRDDQGADANQPEPDASADSGAEIDSGPSTDVIFREEFDSPHDFSIDDSAEWSTWLPEMAETFAVANGALTVIPSATSQNHWYQDSQGPYLYRLVDGDFVAETTVEVSSADDTTSAPVPGFNSAGFVVRDPASTSGAENWVMYNLGAQSQAVPFGVEAKTTIDSGSDLELFAVDDSSRTHRLRVCRVGDDLRYYRASVDAEDWVETEPSTRHIRADFPDALQVGLVSGTWSGSSMRADFERVVAWRVSSIADCTGLEP